MPHQQKRRSRGGTIALRGARRVTGGVQAVAPRTEKYLPNADAAFRTKVESIATTIAKDPARFNIADRDAQLLLDRVKRFSAALNDARNPGARTVSTIKAKDDWRKEVEELARAITSQIRTDSSIERSDKALLGIRERPKKLKKRVCPKSPPVLRYLCGIDGYGSASSVHVLEFRELNAEGTAQKPAGASSLQLFFDMVPVGEPIPKHPAERGWPKYLNEYTRSPIHVEFPMPLSGPMLIVYWGRWSDGRGGYGPWSKTCIARIEGTLALAPGMALPDGAGAREQRMVFIVPPRQLMGEVAKSEDADAQAEATAAIAALMVGGQRVLEAATVRLLDAA